MQNNIKNIKKKYQNYGMKRIRKNSLKKTKNTEKKIRKEGKKLIMNITRRTRKELMNIKRNGMKNRNSPLYYPCSYGRHDSQVSDKDYIEPYMAGSN